jgi:hypothetical protein
MGNGPSLIESLKMNKANLSKVDLVAVNFAGIAPEYAEYKPNVYVLCDPAFWFDGSSEEINAKVRNLYVQIAEKTHWKLQIYLPYQALKKKEIEAKLSLNSNISLCYYNKTKFEGFNFLNYQIYNKQWGMLRAQNVIIAALMLSIFSNYKEIYMAGVDSDFLKNIWVDENNNVRFNDHHYYKNSKENIERKLQVKIHEQCVSLYHMFKSYTEIEKYAGYRKIKIYNIGINSFVDAFEKITII